MKNQQAVGLSTSGTMLKEKCLDFVWQPKTVRFERGDFHVGDSLMNEVKWDGEFIKQRRQRAWWLRGLR